MIQMNDEKILADEILSDEELDNVAGGSCYEIAEDSYFLNSLNGSTGRHAPLKFKHGDPQAESEIKAAWAKLGVGVYFDTSEIERNHHNRYYIKGKEVSKFAAREYAMEMTGHFMNESEWNHY